MKFNVHINQSEMGYGFRIVPVASYDIRAEAEAHVKRLEALGYGAEVVEVK